MYLEKWYADVVEGGQVAQIRYQANLCLGPLGIGYSGRWSGGWTGAVHLGLKRLAMPAVVDGNLHWGAGSDAPADIWGGAKHRPQRLWEERGRAVIWDPVVLNGDVDLEGGRGGGQGYAERLVLNFAPWQLGLKTLRWGRFCGKKHSLVWIEWCGPLPLRLALLDGEAERLQAVDRRGVRTERSRLAMGAPREILSGPLASGALEALGWMRMLAARQFLAGVETKWAAEATLRFEGEGADRGLAIYEEVTWS